MKKSFLLFGLLILAVLLSGTITLGQTKGAWVEYKLPGDRPPNWARMVGENCLIFIDRMAPEIYAFDINSAQWHTYTASTALEWSSQIKVGQNVAMVYNDEMAVAYNGLIQEFAPVTYAGTMLSGTTYGHDCKADMAYFATTQNLYVFDGEDNIWRSYDISSAAGDIISWGVYGIEDYLFLVLNKTDDSKKIVAYSYLTKGFVDYDGEGYVEYNELNHGFIFYKNNTPAADSVTHFFAGYSAFTGDYVLLERAHNLEYWNSMSARGHHGTTAVFEDRYRVVDNNWNIDIFGFDTRFGDFVQTSYNYDYNCQNGIQPDKMAAGSSVGVNNYRDCVDGELTYIVYKGNSNSFQTALEEGLYYPTCGGVTASPQCGGEIFGASDCDYMWFFDTEGWLGSKIALPETVDGVTDPAPQRMYGTWAIGECQRAYDNTVHIYSYNQLDNDNIHTFTFESEYSFSRFDSTNVGGRMSNNIGGPYVLYLYSPGTDSWSTVDFGTSHNLIGKGVQRDYFFWYDTEVSGPMYLFDGVTGVTTSMPFGWAYVSTGNTHKYAWSNFMLAHSADDRYTGYSTYTRTTSEYPSEYLGSWKGQQDLAIVIKTITGGGANVLAYNVLYDNFVMTSYGPEYGTSFDLWPGGKTALIMTLPGYLLAWDPNADAAMDAENNISGNNLPDNYSLSQNYPNPFNPSTIISYSIPRQSDVTISIINLLGQNVKTISNKNQVAGKHEINWDGTDQSGRSVASGIYFYQISTGGYTESKKMILLK